MTKFVISSSFFSPQELMSSYVNYRILILNLEICVFKGISQCICSYNPAFLDLYQSDNAA